MNGSRPSRYDYQFDPDDPNSTAALVCRLVGHDRNVLELGCAAGAMTAVLARHYGCRVIGVEMDQGAALAAAPYAESVHIASLEDAQWHAPLVGQRFDTVLAADVLEHLHDPAACLQQLHSLLEDDGRLVVSVPNIAHGGVIASLLCGQFEYQEVGLLDRTHVHFFTSASLRHMLQENGFKVVHETAAEAGAWHPEFSALWKQLPTPLQRWLERGPASRAYQVIMVARRCDSPSEPVQSDSTALQEWLNELPHLFGESHQASEGTSGAPAQVAELKQRMQNLEAQLNLMRSSWSWRLTAGIRACGRLLRRLRVKS